MKILVMGGSRFVGRPVVSRLLSQGHHLSLFTRGNRSLPAGVEHISGDRHKDQDLRQLAGKGYEVIIECSGRNLTDSQRVLEVTGSPSHRFVYVSSAGVYADSQEFPLREDNPTDPKSRHAGKAETESWLLRDGIPFTSFRPTYIYGPGNYNPIERWFFDRIVYSRPIPLPGNGTTITQLGHVDDLAEAMTRCLDVEASTNRIYNCSGQSGITFIGLIELAAKVCGKDPQQIDIRPFDPSELDPKARKAFPLRLSHFLTDTSRLERELAWKPRFSLADGLKDSYINDYSIGPKTIPDFSIDDSLIGG